MEGFLAGDSALDVFGVAVGVEFLAGGIVGVVVR
jgi:hypothetical protein